MVDILSALKGEGGCLVAAQEWRARELCYTHFILLFAAICSENYLHHYVLYLAYRHLFHVSPAHISSTLSLYIYMYTHTHTEGSLPQVKLRDPVPHRAVHGVSIIGKQQVSLSVHTTAQGGEFVVKLAHSCCMLTAT